MEEWQPADPESEQPASQAGVLVSDTVLIKKQGMLVLVELEGREELRVVGRRRTLSLCFF